MGELAESESGWPAIVVHRASMTVVDGVHRLCAARMRGEERIAVRFFDGAVEDAALLAVAVNVTHGRALPVADRVAAAERMVVERPGWSDRAVAAVAGLSARKVAEVRRACGADTPVSGVRVGRDGRARAVGAGSAQAREVACRLLREEPGASLRQIARRAGLSPATVADVRDRLRRGEDPLPPRQRAAQSRTAACAAGPEGVAVVRVAGPAPAESAGLSGAESAGTSPAAGAGLSGAGSAGLPVSSGGVSAGVTPLIRAHAQPGRQAVRSRSRGSRSPVELLAIFDALRRDPSLRLNDAGRNVLRLLDACAVVVRDRRRLVDAVPAHCRSPLSELAEGYAEVWHLLAEELCDMDLADTDLSQPSSLGA